MALGRVLAFTLAAGCAKATHTEPPHPDPAPPGVAAEAPEGVLRPLGSSSRLFSDLAPSFAVEQHMSVLWYAKTTRPASDGDWESGRLVEVGWFDAAGSAQAATTVQSDCRFGDPVAPSLRGREGGLLLTWWCSTSRQPPSRENNWRWTEAFAPGHWVLEWIRLDLTDDTAAPAHEVRGITVPAFLPCGPAVTEDERGAIRAFVVQTAGLTLEIMEYRPEADDPTEYFRSTGAVAVALKQSAKSGCRGPTEFFVTVPEADPGPDGWPVDPLWDGEGSGLVSMVSPCHAATEFPATHTRNERVCHLTVGSSPSGREVLYMRLADAGDYGHSTITTMPLHGAWRSAGDGWEPIGPLPYGPDRLMRLAPHDTELYHLVFGAGAPAADDLGGAPPASAGSGPAPGGRVEVVAATSTGLPSMWWEPADRSPIVQTGATFPIGGAIEGILFLDDQSFNRNSLDPLRWWGFGWSASCVPADRMTVVPPKAPANKNEPQRMQFYDTSTWVHPFAPCVLASDGKVSFFIRGRRPLLPIVVGGEPKAVTVLDSGDLVMRSLAWCVGERCAAPVVE